MRDAEGAICNLQYIAPNGSKRFVKDAPVTGLRHTIRDAESCAGFLVGEGFATVASVVEAANSAKVAGIVAFNAGNLLAVATSLRSRYPDKQIMLLADNDRDTEGNPGLTKARAAAEAVDGWFAVPSFGEDAPGATDFDDVRRLYGLEELKRQLNQARPVAVPQIMPPEQPLRLADPAMAAATVTPNSAQAELEAAVNRVLLSNFGAIDERRALDAIAKQAKAPKREFNARVKELQSEHRDAIAAAAPKPWLGKLYVKGEETDPHPTMSNACIVLREAPAWGGVLWYNEFTGMLHVRVCPPWEGARAGQPCDRPWTDADEAAATEWMQRYGGIPTIDGWRIFSAVSRVAAETKFHPVRDYLDGFDFDQAELATVHFEDWLTRYCGVDDTPYSRAIGSRFLISMPARIYLPGCKADCALVLEGPQGIKKSTVFKTLASEPWFTDATEEVGSKDAALNRRGKWLWEYAELDNLARADISRVKADMSRTHDRFRPPYGRNTIEEPRQCVHGGTVNDSQYLRDPTGARRFWPARCGVIDIEALARDRDKLFAVAVQRYRAKANWFLDTPKLVELAKAEQDARYVPDAWDPIITEWLDEQRLHTVTVAHVLFEALDIRDKSKWSDREQARVVKCLRRLGWEHKQVRIGSRAENKRAWRWVKPLELVTNGHDLVTDERDDKDE